MLDTFFVTDGKDGGMVGREAREHFEEVLLKALTEAATDLHPLIARKKSARPLYQAHSGERIETRIYFDNDTSAHYTVIDLETEDHLGLLYAISQVLTELGLDIALAKISTEKGAAIDSFFVADPDTGKVRDLARQRLIAERLLGALHLLQ